MQDHPTTPAGLYETMQLPDPVLTIPHNDMDDKTEQPNSRRRDKYEVKRRKGNTEVEHRRESRAERKRRKVEVDGYEPVRNLMLWLMLVLVVL